MCKDRCEDDDDDAKCSMGGNQDFLDDVVSCLDNKKKYGLSCYECE